MAISVALAEDSLVLTDIRMPPTGPSYALALLENGSDRRAYLLKQRVHERQELVRAIRSVADGGSVIDPKIAQGKSNTAIAESLVLTKRAVEKHIDVSKRVMFLTAENSPPQ